jgi:hypothetical protein
VSITGGLMLLVYTLVKTSAWGWGSSRTIVLFGVSAALIAGFVQNSRPAAGDKTASPAAEESLATTAA